MDGKYKLLIQGHTWEALHFTSLKMENQLK
jgi:hypothetical protein